MKSSTQDQAEDTFHKIKGKVKEVTGKLSDNKELESEGANEKIAGKVQERRREGKVKKGNRILATVFGSGYTWGTAVFQI